MLFVAFGDITTKIRPMIALRILPGVVKNKYKNDVGRLAAWFSASHIEQAPKKKKETPTPTT